MVISRPWFFGRASFSKVKPIAQSDTNPRDGRRAVDLGGQVPEGTVALHPQHVAKAVNRRSDPERQQCAGIGVYKAIAGVGHH